MDIVGDRKFVEVPGGKTHELPPLLVHNVSSARRLDRMMEIAGTIIEQEEMLPFWSGDDLAEPDQHERRKMDLALNLVDRYLGLLAHWHWGDAIVEWIRQCEVTFGTRPELRNLLRNDLWPHAGRCSFVQLLADKGVETEGVDLERSVGLRLAFRQMPPIRCCSDQFLFYLKDSLAATAYQTWQHLTPSPISCLPPERFDVQVLNTSLEVH